MKQFLILATIALSACGNPTKKEKKAEAKPKAWTKLCSDAGTGSKPGKPFVLETGEVRLIYGLRSGGFATTFNIGIMDKGIQKEMLGAYMDVSENDFKNMDDTVYLTKDAGEHYVAVMAANTKWAYYVEELR
jgi:hypothetical protein